MNLSRLVTSFQVRRLQDNDVPEILKLCRQNELYYQYRPPFVSRRSIIEDVTARPPGVKRQDKYYLGYFADHKLMAIIDLIWGYPEQSNAYIGFFMVAASVHGRGIGSQIIQELTAYLKANQITSVKLGWAKNNPQAAYFWKKNGFVATGITSDHENQPIVLAERCL